MENAKLLALKIGNTEFNSPVKAPDGSEITNLGQVINIVTQNLVLPVAGIILFFVFIAGGYQLLTSQGEAEKINKGKAMMTTGIIGFVILVLAFVITRLIGYIFNIDGGIFG